MESLAEKLKELLKDLLPQEKEEVTLLELKRKEKERERTDKK